MFCERQAIQLDDLAALSGRNLYEIVELLC